MKCPYCLSEVARVRTKNSKQLSVIEGDDVWDSNISLYQCLDNYAHFFYADNQDLNDQTGLPVFKFGS